MPRRELRAWWHYARRTVVRSRSCRQPFSPIASRRVSTPTTSSSAGGDVGTDQQTERLQIQMDDKLRNKFLSAPNTAVLATVDAKGRAHAVPVWYLWTGNVFEIIGGKNSAKMKHVELNGRAALCVDKRGSGAFHITAEGPCQLGDTATKAWRLKLHTHYRGSDAAERIVAGDGHLSQRFLTLRPERWYGWTAAELK